LTDVVLSSEPTSLYAAVGTAIAARAASLSCVWERWVVKVLVGLRRGGVIQDAKKKEILQDAVYRYKKREHQKSKRSPRKQRERSTGVQGPNR
jgi:hypothetical protein